MCGYVSVGTKEIIAPRRVKIDREVRGRIEVVRWIRRGMRQITTDCSGSRPPTFRWTRRYEEAITNFEGSGFACRGRGPAKRRGNGNVPEVLKPRINSFLFPAAEKLSTHKLAPRILLALSLPQRRPSGHPLYAPSSTFRTLDSPKHLHK